MFWYTFGETQLSLHVYFLTQVNKGRKLSYDDKHSMKGAIKVREYLQVSYLFDETSRLLYGKCTILIFE